LTRSKRCEAIASATAALSGGAVDRAKALEAAELLLTAVRVHTKAFTVMVLTLLAEVVNLEAPDLLHLLRGFLCLGEAEFQLVVSRVCRLVVSKDIDAFCAWYAAFCGVKVRQPPASFKLLRMRVVSDTRRVLRCCTSAF
jgi:hypothetical protein